MKTIMWLDELLAKYGIQHPPCGFYTGEGWKDILDRLIKDLIKLGWDKNLQQVKEKFGGLRFYIKTENQAIRDRIRLAEQEASKTCESCSKPASIKSYDGYLQCLCEECEKQ